MVDVDLNPGARVVIKWHDGEFYPGRIQRRLRSGRYCVDCDDGDEITTELQNIFVSTSILADIARMLKREKSTLQKLQDAKLALQNAKQARDAVRSKLRKEQNDIAREREEIAGELQRTRLERDEIQATESGIIIAGLRRTLAEKVHKIEILEKLLGSHTPALSSASAVIHGD